jgi:hypothetical protein
LAKYVVMHWIDTAAVGMVLELHHRGKSERALYVRHTGGAFHKHYSSREAQGRRDEHPHGVWGTVNVTRRESAAVGSFG